MSDSHQGALTGTETLGNSVAISGDTVVVGSWPFGTDIGGAFVYERVAGVAVDGDTSSPASP